VQRSSDTIGTIAAALAKAQAQLINPENHWWRLSNTMRLVDQNGISLRAAVERS
jgi:hypothetical protein